MNWQTVQPREMKLTGNIVAALDSTEESRKSRYKSTKNVTVRKGLFSRLADSSPSVDAQVRSIPEPNFAPGPKPEVTNDPEDILRAWTAFEVLAPQGFAREADLVGGENSRIAKLDSEMLPWERGEKSRPKKKLYYELILGTIDIGPAVEVLLKLHADDRLDMPLSQRHSPIASLLLDKTGAPIEHENALAISSFASGVPVALQGDLKKHAQWTAVERGIVQDLGRDSFEKTEMIVSCR